MLKLTEEVKEDIKEDIKELEKEESVEEGNTSESKTKKEKKDKYKEQITKLESELALQRNEYLKVYAEMENTKRRLKEESIKERKYASQKVVGDLINPIDMLLKIVNSEAPSTEIANYLIGFKMISTQLMDILKQEGLSEIDALNKPFNPELMQAMSTEVNEDVEEHTVLKVMQSGYMYKDRILRPAMVVVSKKNKEEKEEK